MYTQSRLKPVAHAASLCSLLLLATTAEAIRPLSETDMGTVSAESQSLEALLNVSGETAAGDVVEAVTPDSSDLGSAITHADDNSRRSQDEPTDLDTPVVSAHESQKLDSGVFESIETHGSTSKYGKSLSISDPRLSSILSEQKENGLSITVNANIQRVQTENMSHGLDGASRGSQYLTNIQTQSTTLITPR